MSEKPLEHDSIKILLYSIQCIVMESSLLLRRFVFRMAEASAKRVTGDEPQGTVGRVETVSTGPA